MKIKVSVRLFLIPFFYMLMLTEGLAQAPVVSDGGYRGGSIPGIEKTPDALHFILMGDWGRNGENYQKEVAAQMGKAAHDLDADFVVTTGDNFYPYGVQSTQDYHWISSFESIYRAQSLHVKWYPVLGNHDYGSNPDAEIAYSSISSRWSMPARYYSKTFSLQGDTAQRVLMVFIDTDPIEKELSGNPPDRSKYPAGGVEAQKLWLEKELAKPARWKFVIGHHTVYTGGWRRDDPDTKKLRGVLEPLFAKYAVDFYLCGHDHHLEYTKPAGITHYIVSGSASEGREVALNPEGGKFASSQQGFGTLSVTREKVLVQFITHAGKIIYKTRILRGSR